jgi:hypothetical protein
VSKLIFGDAVKFRDSITAKQRREIKKLYEDWAKSLQRKIDYYHFSSAPSSALQEANLRALQSSLTSQAKVIGNNLRKMIEDNMYLMSEAVVKNNIDFMSMFGFPQKGLSYMFTSVPDEVVRNLVNGNVYKSGWSLSKAIWSDSEKTMKDIYTIVAQGRAQNSSAYEIAKNLEKYVNPNKAKQWNLKMADGRRIYKKSVDYNAQRLARTLTQHTYQQSLIATSQENPFIDQFIWWANGSRSCAECEERDGQIFKGSELPMDHPNGMCTMEPYVDEKKMVNDLSNWVNSEEGTYPEIDEFASKLGYNGEEVSRRGVRNALK